VPVIVAGGKGLRLWPQSREAVPKPFVSVTGHKHTLLQSTFERLKIVPEFTSPLVVCNASHNFLVQTQATSVGRDDVLLLLEPEGRNTTPVICAAALMIKARYS
jgi:mannose-1-phosphate guanylyltransferase